MKLEPLIRDRVRSPFVDRPEVLDQIIHMPFTSAMVRLYAALKPSTKSVLEVRHVPTLVLRYSLLRMVSSSMIM